MIMFTARTRAFLGGKYFCPLIGVGLLLHLCGSGASAQTVFPGATWTFKTPAEVGMDGATLDQIAAIVGNDGCIVRNGYMVKTWGSQTNKNFWASAAKPVISTLLFYAIEEGRIPGVNAYVKDHGWSMISKDQTMTFHHMANMMGTYTLAQSNGTVWAYSDYNIQLYIKTLFDHVYGQNSDTVATAPSRLGALQLQDGSLFNTSNNWVVTSVRDFTRIGWFWLNKGNWGGVQRLPRHYFDDFQRPQVPANMPVTSGALDPSGDYLGIGSYGGGTNQTPYGPGIYGYNWWFNATGGANPNSKTWPDAPSDTFQANGLWNRETCTVIPSLGIVMSFNRTSALGNFAPGDPNGTMNQVLKLLTQSVVTGTPRISLSPTLITRTVRIGQNLPNDTFTVTNTGVGTLNYQVTDNQTWLLKSPTTGSSTGEQDTITISYAVSQLSVGTYQAVIQVSDNGSSPAASNSPQTVTVTVTVKKHGK